MYKVAITSLGCPRNLNDSEVMLGYLHRAGFKITQPEEGPDILIINTCAFIGAARAESSEAISEALKLKRTGSLEKVVVCGCFPQMYGKRPGTLFEGVDLVLGTSDVPKIGRYLKEVLSTGTSRFLVSKKLDYMYSDNSPRALMTPPHYAFVKISEGCSNLCSYCVIPKLRGRFRSRSIPSVIKEVNALSEDGRLKEINLIGQDTTLFGVDRYQGMRFSELLRGLCRQKNSVRWIRILYTHPAHYSDELISVIREEKKMCKYLDLPIQHISDKMLKNMNRKTTAKDIKALIEKLRKQIPGISLRTSIIVGFPGESQKDFKELISFVKEARFEKLGVFMYSKEEGTSAASFKGQIPESVKASRLDELMRLQQEVSVDMNRSFMGKTLEVLIDEKVDGEKGQYLGRTCYDAPEVDGIVYVKGRGLAEGDMCRVRITGTMEYDLTGEMA